MALTRHYTPRRQQVEDLSPQIATSLWLGVLPRFPATRAPIWWSGVVRRTPKYAPDFRCWGKRIPLSGGCLGCGARRGVAGECVVAVHARGAPEVLDAGRVCVRPRGGDPRDAHVRRTVIHCLCGEPADRPAVVTAQTWVSTSVGVLSGSC